MAKELTEVSPGIFQIVLASGSKNVSQINIFIIPGKDREKDRSLMIDAGFYDKKCLEDLEWAMEELKISFDKLDLFLTHKHFDHCGQACVLEGRGTRIFMDPAEERHHYDCLHYNSHLHDDQEQVLKYAGITPERTPKLWELFTAVVEKDLLHELNISRFRYTPIEPGQIFCYGDYKLEAISLPGHTFGQMGLVEREHKLFFIADQVIRNIVPIVGTSFKDEHLLTGYFKSLEMVKTDYSDYRLFPAHDTVLEGALIQKTIDKIAFAYLEKIQIIEQLVRHGRRPMTVVQIAMLAYGVQGLPKDQAQLMFLKMVTSKTFSCLEYLRDQDFVFRSEEDGVLYWEAE